MRWRSRAWYAKPTMAKHIPNADLWHEVDRQLENERSEEVRVVWVKGHGTKALVDAGVGLRGNAGAD